ncbi:exosortase B [Parasulfuritortus cantonensis]|nr:exosortase B [Parasulfuritortus cantonensis]
MTSRVAGAPPAWLAWLPVLLGLAVLYLPTWWDLAHGLWLADEQAHGPLILLVSLYLAWQQRAAFAADSDVPSPAAAGHTRPVLGWGVLLFGLLAYALGRSQEILLFEVGSQIPVLFGVLLITLGGPAVRRLWFPVLFLAFMVPLPGFVVDGLTGPLKQFVSAAASNILHGVGYPVARSGVILTIGAYQLLVADACSGLHSIFSLSALGLLYMHLMRHTGVLRNALLLASIVPIAVAANVVRVILLILITYHFGDAAGQGFAHDFTGMVLFMVGLLAMMGFDVLLGAVAFRNRPRSESGSTR